MCINIAGGKQVERATLDVNGSHLDWICEALIAVEHWNVISMNPAPEDSKMSGKGGNIWGPGETKNVRPLKNCMRALVGTTKFLVLDIGAQIVVTTSQQASCVSPQTTHCVKYPALHI